MSSVKKVANTKIYVSPDKENKRQLTVYSNEVATEDENAMILPVPNPESIELLDLSSYPKFFEDCEACFTRVPTLGLRSAQAYSSLLPVVQVGSYLASIVPSLYDFSRVNSDVFDYEDDLIRVLEQNYREGFGFILCVLKKGNNTYHPFAYTHDMIRPNRLFIPTRHYHPGESHFSADWDHIIYSPITELNNPREVKFRDTTSIKWKKLPESYRWAYSVPLCRWEMEGEWKNIDLEPESYYRKPIY